MWLAWQRVAREVAEGVLGAEFDRADRVEVQLKVSDAEEASKDAVWASYRFVALSDSEAQYGLNASTPAPATLARAKHSVAVSSER